MERKNKIVVILTYNRRIYGSVWLIMTINKEKARISIRTDTKLKDDDT